MPISTISDLSQAIVDWAKATAPSLNTEYPFPTGEQTGALPAVIAEIARDQTVTSPPSDAFPFLQVQQVRLWKLRQYRVLLFVTGEDQQGARTAQQAADELTGLVDALSTKLVTDHTLGSRVYAASPLSDTQLDPMFAIFDDATQGLLAQMTVLLAEPAL